MAVVVAELLALLKLDKKDFDKDMRSSKRDIEGFDQRLGKAANNVRDFGNKMTLATAPIAIGFGIALHQTKEFDSLMTNVNAILGITGQEAKDLRSEILAYGGSTRQGPIAVADAYYEIVSGVADASTHMAILDAAVRTADAGQADLTATTGALISTMNSYGFAAEEAAHVSDVFTMTVGMGVLTMDELASAMPQVTGLASSLGITIDDLGGQMAFLTAQGFSAGNSATFLKSMMTTLLNPTASLQEAITALGYDTGESMINTLGLVGSYEALKKYNNGTFAGLITNQEALQGATALTKDEFAEFNTVFQAGVAGATDAAVAIQDSNATWDDLSSKMEQASITIGSQLAPIIIALIDNAILPAITAVTDWMTANPELTQTLVLMGGALVVLGPVISMVGTAMTVVTSVMGAAKAAVGALSVTMNSAVAPIIAIGVAIAGVIAQVNEFNRVVGGAQDYARKSLLDEFQEGAVSRQKLDDASFAAVANEFGGGVFGDVIARLSYSNFSDAVQPTEYRAIGGGVSAGKPYMVGEEGPEMFVPDSGGEIVPNGGGSGVTINVYQRQGESGELFANRLAELMVNRGLSKAA